MNLQKQLKDRNLKWNWDAIADYVIQHPELMEELIRFSFEGETIIQRNASAVISKICDKKRDLLSPYLIEIFQHLEKYPNDAVRRNTMRIFQFTEIPEEIEGELFETALKYIRSINEPIAVKAFSITVARRICQKYPELAPELIYILEIILKEKISTGLTNRAGKEIQKLRKVS